MANHVSAKGQERHRFKMCDDYAAITLNFSNDPIHGRNASSQPAVPKYISPKKHCHLRTRCLNTLSSHCFLLLSLKPSSHFSTMMLGKPSAALRANQHRQISRPRPLVLKAVMAPAASDTSFDQSAGEPDRTAISKRDVAAAQHITAARRAN
jgi:hypothetical protein